MAEFTYNGIRYRELPNGQAEVIGTVASGTYIPPSSTSRRTKEAGADKAEIDAQQGAATLPYAAPQAAANVGKTQVDTAVTQEQLDKAITARERGQVEETTRTKALDAFNAAPDLEKLADDIQAAFDSGVGKTSGVAGALDFLPTGENREFGLIGGRARGTFKQALGFTGGEGNTAGELTINYGPYIPNQYDTNEEVKRKIASIRELAYTARKKAISYLGGVPDAAGRVSPLPRNMSPEQLDSLYKGAPVQIDEKGQMVLPSASLGRPDSGIQASGVQDAASGGMTRVPEFRGMADDVIRKVQEGASADEIIGYMAARARAANYPPPSDGQVQFIRDVVSGRERNPNAPARSLGSNWGMLEMVENPDVGGSLTGKIADSTFGAGAISAANAVTAGNLGNIAGDNAGGVINAIREERPVPSFIGDVVGSGIGMAGANRFASLVPGGAALTGMGGLGSDALYGGTRGYSEGDGDWRYALLGAGAAAAGNRAGAGLFGGDRVPRPIEKALDTSPLRRIAETLGGEIPPRPSAAKRLIASDVGDRGGEIAAMLSEGKDLGAPLTPADTLPQLRARAGAAFRNAGPEARNAVTDFQQRRQLGQGDRALSQIEQSFGPTANPNRVAESLMQEARASASPLYASAYAAPGRMTPELESILRTPAGQQALRNAQQISANERRDPNALGFNALDAEGNIALTQTPSMETLDLVKRGLDQVIETRRDPVTGRLPTSDPSFSAVTGVRSQLVRELDALNPDYAAARTAYAGPAQARDAMQQGQGFMRMAPRDIEDQMGRMGSNQQDMYRLGGRTALADKVEQSRTTANPWQAIYGSPVAQQRIGAVFPEGADRFGRAYALENEMARTGNELLGGSPTATRLAADQQLGNQVGEQLVNGAVDTAITGAPIRTGVSLLGKGLAKAGVGGMKEDAANEIAQILALPAEPDIIAQLLSEVAARRSYIDNLRGAGSRTGSALLVPIPFAGGGGE